MSTETIMKIISMLVSCAIWAGAFIAVTLITKKAGMKGNLPKESKDRLVVCRQFVNTFVEKMNDDEEDHEKDLVIAFKKLKHLQRAASKVFAVFAFEHPDVWEYKNVMSSYGKMFNECKKVSAEIAMKQYDKIDEHLRSVLNLIDETDKLLDIAIVKDNEERILNA